MKDERYENVNWVIKGNYDGTVNNDSAQIAVLVDIRDELQKLNAVLNCRNFLSIPSKLDEIRINTKQKRKRKTPAKRK